MSRKKINGTKMNCFPFIDFVALPSHIRGTQLLFTLFRLLMGSPVNTEGESGTWRAGLLPRQVAQANG